MKAILVKFHQNVVAICDKELLGKTFTEGKFELKVSGQFYGGHEEPEEKVMEILKNAKNINIVGKRSIGLAIKCGVVAEDSVILIQKIPHAQIFSLLK